MDGGRPNITANVDYAGTKTSELAINPLTIRISGKCSYKEARDIWRDLHKHRLYSMFTYRPTVVMKARVDNGMYVAYDVYDSQVLPELDIDCHLALLGLLMEDKYEINERSEQWVKKFNRLAVYMKKEKKSKEGWQNICQRKRMNRIIKWHKNFVKFKSKWRRDKFVSSIKEVNYPPYFLRHASVDGVRKFCRSNQYRPEPGEACFSLKDDQTLNLIERLQMKIITHPTMKDKGIHQCVLEKLRIPEEMLQWNRTKLKQFLRTFKKGQLKIYHSRGLILGCEGVGKTTLLKKLKDLDISEIKNTESTKGLEIHSNVFAIQENELKVNKDENVSNMCLDVKNLRSIDRSPKQKNSRKETQKNSCSNLIDRSRSEEHQDTTSDTVQPSTSQQSAREVTSIPPKKVETKSLGAGSEISQPTHVTKNQYASNVLEMLRNKFQHGENPLQTIDILDFAGQVGYYASHHVFLSKRAFYILVVDISKSLDEVAGNGNENDRMFKKWTHRKFIEFWLKSIHSFSSPTAPAPVLLVASHAENKSDEEVYEFFTNIWRGLDKNLRDHLNHEREFFVVLENQRNIPKIRKCIVDTVQGQHHWGEELPSVWVLFENLITQKREEIKVIEFELLWNLHLSEFPRKLHLKRKNDMKIMLQFFHEIGLVMFFGQASLSKTVILDVQFLIDAFKCIITTPNHGVQIITRAHLNEWELFLETGELGDVLLTALWRQKEDFIRSRSVLLSYMKKLGMLTEISQNSSQNKEQQPFFLVPCMNKKQFAKENFNDCLCSSILCFQFEFLPNTIFYRLISKCNSQEWTLLTEGNEKCIYQTAAAFFHNNHVILVGTSRNTIQVQVLVLKDADHGINKKLSAKVGNTVLAILDEIKNTCHTNLTFSTGYLCKAGKFCDEKNDHFIPAKKLESDDTKMPCPKCEIPKKQTIDAQEVKSFWVEREGEEEKSQTDLVLDFVSGKSIKAIMHHADEFESDQDEMDHLQGKYRNQPKELIFQFLLNWKRRTPKFNHVYKLRQFLKEIERGDVVNEIEKFDRTTYHCSKVPNSNELVSKQDIRLLAKHIPTDFSSCLRFIGINEYDMERIKQDNQNQVQHQIVKCFEEMQEQGTLSRQIVCDGLKYVKRYDVIHKLMSKWE